nr:MAG TPA: hypothetical protein [Caudoviricetes sp.]
MESIGILGRFAIVEIGAKKIRRRIRVDCNTCVYG